MERWNPVHLPYAKPPDELPAPLPTASQIRKSTDIISQRTGQAIVTYGPHLLIKYGQATPEREGQTLLYLEQNLSDFPAPRLYAMYYDNNDLFIVMERIKGRTLDLLWPNLSDDEKVSITHGLRRTFDRMREAPAPTPMFLGSVDRGPLPHHIFWDPDHDRKFCGPFDNELDFNSAMLAQYQRIQEENQLPLYKQAFYSAHLGDVLRGHRSTLTHADVQRKNIIVVDQDAYTTECFGSSRVVIVDWECAGWYPEYWEYFAAFVAFRWNDDWPSRLEEFLIAYAAETTMMAMIYRELFF